MCPTTNEKSWSIGKLHRSLKWPLKKYFRPYNKNPSKCFLLTTRLMLRPVSRRLRTSSCITLSVPGHYINNNDHLWLGGLPAGCHTRTGWCVLKILQNEKSKWSQCPSNDAVCLSSTDLSQSRGDNLPRWCPLDPSPTPPSANHKPLFSIIDPEQANENYNQWRRL